MLAGCESKARANTALFSPEAYRDERDVFAAANNQDLANVKRLLGI
jgi:hypothetical protein